MKCSEFRRFLKSNGVEFVRHAKGSHWIIRKNDRYSTFADHGAKEMREGTRLKIIKDLGL